MRAARTSSSPAAKSATPARAVAVELVVEEAADPLEVRLAAPCFCSCVQLAAVATAALLRLVERAS